MTASPGKTYSNDILGNRTSMKGNVVYTWEALVAGVPELTYKSNSNTLRLFAGAVSLAASLGYQELR